jgi:tetratricopeptide (TPR) repeat protein
VTDQPVSEKRAGPVDPDAYAALEEQRDFLLASLDDLEREREAGDIDEADYAALRDDYTARAAAVLRALDEGGARFAAAKRPGSWRKAALLVAVVVVLAAGVGLFVAQSSGSRTDELPESSRDRLAECLASFSEGEVLEAVKCYDGVLEDDPENVEALTYKGWALVQATLVEDGMGYLDRALEANPGYSPARVFRAYALQQLGRPEEALEDLDRADESQIPPAFVGLIENLRQELQAAAESPTSTTTGG